MNAEKIRNIAIIAHVDHGKTTLVDQLLRQSGVFRENQAIEERVMDSMDLEREKGITIKAKNTSVLWKGYTINIVDTPGHADFGAEVERVMKMVDGVLLLVDAAEGPQAQTRWVLKKALSHQLNPVVVVNKVDRENAQPELVHGKVLELFLDLEASEDQFNAPFLYGSARDGWTDRDLESGRKNMDALFETIIENIPSPEIEAAAGFRMLVSNIDWNDFVGRVAIGRILSGSIKQGEKVFSLRKQGVAKSVKITKLFTYRGLKTSDSEEGIAGDIIGLAGFDEIDIGDTLAINEEAERLTFVQIDPPTIQMEFSVNDGPLAGRDGKKVTSRQIGERLYRETQSNISISIEETNRATTFKVNARGAMQIAILVETMRREGFEVLVSRPNVLNKTIDGILNEPFERIWVEVSSNLLGGVIESLSNRKASISNLEHHHSGVTVEAEIPTRGLIGFESELVNLTSGSGVMSHLFHEFRPVTGEIVTRRSGTLVSMDNGKAAAYALDALQLRGKLFIKPGDQVYPGQIVGENPRNHNLPVNPTKEKQLDNMRAAGSDKAIQLIPPVQFSLERAIEYIETDELVEATPNHLRLRKRILDANDRRKEEKRRAAKSETSP